MLSDILIKKFDEINKPISILEMIYYIKYDKFMINNYEYQNKELIIKETINGNPKKFLKKIEDTTKNNKIQNIVLIYPNEDNKLHDENNYLLNDVIFWSMNDGNVSSFQI